MSRDLLTKGLKLNTLKSNFKTPQSTFVKNRQIGLNRTNLTLTGSYYFE